MQAFRNMNEISKGATVKPEENDFGGKIIENYRPPLPLGDRTLRASFKS